MRLGLDARVDGGLVPSAVRIGSVRWRRRIELARNGRFCSLRSGSPDRDGNSPKQQVNQQVLAWIRHQVETGECRIQT